MRKFLYVAGVAAPLPLINVDTDMIIPKQFLKSPSRQGYGPALFHELRYDESGNERPEFILNRKPFRDAVILVSGENFGCGSSREHAPWAIEQFGIRCIIAPSFADIFATNCCNNGILPAAAEISQVERLLALLTPDTCNIEVDLQSCLIRLADGSTIEFRIDPYRRRQLLDGLDAVGLTLEREAQIASFEAMHWNTSPWLAPKPLP